MTEVKDFNIFWYPRNGIVVMGVIGSTAFLMLSLLTLYLSNPNEDAFILFKYVNNFVAGHGVAYFPGGPRTEGATDFFWFALLVGFAWLGFDVALAAALLNAIGAGLVSALLAELVARTKLNKNVRVYAYLLILSVPVTGGAVASYVGFSSMLYSGLVLLMFRISTSSHQRHLTPLVALAVALFRPDGAIIGAVTVAIALWWERRNEMFSLILCNLVIAFVVGCAYFLGRLAYFGMILPLPLYVKSTGTILRDVTFLGLQFPYYKGLDTNLNWLADTFGPTPLIVAAFLIFIVTLGSDRFLKRQVIATLPVIALLLSLSFVDQAQNAFLRFQAPIFLVVLYVVFGYALRRVAATNNTGKRLVALIVLSIAVAIPSANGVYLILGPLAHSSYVESMSHTLALAARPTDSIVLTEAGRMAFWWPGPAYDLGGLNNADTARQPASAAYIASLDPDIVFLHPITLINSTQAETALTEVIDPTTLRDKLRPSIRTLMDGPSKHYDQYTSIPNYAAAAALKFLLDSQNYHILVLPKDKAEFPYVLGIRANYARSPEMLKNIQSIYAGDGFEPYAKIQEFPGANAAWLRDTKMALAKLLSSLRKLVYQDTDASRDRDKLRARCCE